MNEEPGNRIGAEEPGGEPSVGPEEFVDEVTPRGTLFVMMVYIIILAGMWGVLYWTMISR